MGLLQLQWLVSLHDPHSLIDTMAVWLKKKKNLLAIVVSMVTGRVEVSGGGENGLS